MKVLLVDSGYIEYFQGFSKACMQLADTTIITGKYAEVSDERVIKLFFGVSDRMKKKKIGRYVVRVFEYIYAEIYILFLIRKEKYDIVHFHWALLPQIDSFFFRRYKKYCGKIVFTAHDVLPHIERKKNIYTRRLVYSAVDKIIVHGESLKKELCSYYPEFKNKVYIQPHGAFERELGNKSANITIKEIEEAKQRKGKIFLLIGSISYYKGFDRVLKWWAQNQTDSDNLLICAGAIIEKYESLMTEIERASECKNILYIFERLTNEKHDYLYKSSDIVVIPYRKASMSGVFFSAAKFEKTVLFTLSGAISEYIDSDINNCFSVENSDSKLAEKLEFVIKNFTKEDLRVMGKDFSAYISGKYLWFNIVKDVIENCYMDI